MSSIRQPILDPKVTAPRPDPQLRASLQAQIRLLIQRGQLKEIIATYDSGAQRAKAAWEIVGHALGLEYKPEQVETVIHFPSRRDAHHTATFAARRGNTEAEIRMADEALEHVSLPFALEDYPILTRRPKPKARAGVPLRVPTTTKR